MNLHVLEVRAKERAYYMYINGDKSKDGYDFNSDYDRYIEAFQIEKINYEKELDEQFLAELDTELLTSKQIEALERVNKSCRKKHDEVIKTLSKYNPDPNTFLIEKFQSIPLYINVPVRHINDIANDTHYRNQFETKKSSGTLSRHSRSLWERKLFGYHLNDITDFERPKYGNIPINVPNVDKEHKLNNITKGYGSIYFVLKDEVKKRATFTCGDSHCLSMEHVSNFNYPSNAMYYNQIIYSSINTKGFYDEYRYFELQIHGPVRLDTDVDILYYPNGHEYDTIYAEAFKLLEQKGIQIKSYTVDK